MLDRNTSEQSRPMASLREIPVISSAARLNEVIRQSRSTVKTPSEILSKIAFVLVVFVSMIESWARVMPCLSPEKVFVCITPYPEPVNWGSRNSAFYGLYGSFYGVWKKLLTMAVFV